MSLWTVTDHLLYADSLGIIQTNEKFYMYEMYENYSPYPKSLTSNASNARCLHYRGISEIIHLVKMIIRFWISLLLIFLTSVKCLFTRC